MMFSKKNIISFLCIIISSIIWSNLLFAQNKNAQKSRRTVRVIPMQEVQVASPDGNVKFSLSTNTERLTYKITMGQDVVLDPSPIIMKCDGYDLTSGVIFERSEQYNINESYQWRGAHSTAVNNCNGVKIYLENDLSFIDFILDVRAFDDGVAFRIIVPGQADDKRYPDEYSTFVIPKGSTVWYHDLDGHYEAEYQKKDISDVQPGEWGGPPLTFKLPQNLGYGSIAEANLVNYSGMALESDGRRGWIIGLGNRQPINYPFELRYGREEAKRLAQLASVTGTITTPWRVVMAARDLNTLVNSTIIPNLCPAPDSKLFPDGINTSWVKPGLSVWKYLDGGTEGYDGLKEFSRMAGELGYEYQIVEGVWHSWSMEERRQFIDYSKKQGVKILFWEHSNNLKTPEAREIFFKMLHELGAAGAKIDFFDHEAKEIIDFYEELCRKAAEYQLVLDFHGANKPTGRERTWANELVREGIRGMESSRLKERARHETIVPFTRYLAGHADYTTMIFSERKGDTNWPHQIACLTIFSSPLLTVAANPQTILINPAVDLIKNIPAVWDETIVLPDSKIGELAAYARRKNDIWFLSIMCGPEAKTIQVPLSFLGDGKYEGMLVSDDFQNSDSEIVSTKEFVKNDIIKVQMIAGGGFIARFSK